MVPGFITTASSWSSDAIWEVGVGDVLVVLGNLQSQDHCVLEPLSSGTFPHSPRHAVTKAHASTPLADPALSSHPCLRPRIASPLADLPELLLDPQATVFCRVHFTTQKAHYIFFEASERRHPSLRGTEQAWGGAAAEFLKTPNSGRLEGPK